jgi:hypothetical protein
VPFTTAAHPEDLKIPTTALDRYCAECGIVNEQERHYAGHLLMSLFASGVRDPIKLVAGLYAAVECKPPQAV